MNTLSLQSFWSQILNPGIQFHSTARQAMHALCNTRGRSGNHSCRGKTISITYSQFVSVALFIQHEKLKHRIELFVVCPVLPHFFHIIS